MTILWAPSDNFRCLCYCFLFHSVLSHTWRYGLGSWLSAFFDQSDRRLLAQRCCRLGLFDHLILYSCAFVRGRGSHRWLIHYALRISTVGATHVAITQLLGSFITFIAAFIQGEVDEHIFSRCIHPGRSGNLATLRLFCVLSDSRCLTTIIVVQCGSVTLCLDFRWDIIWHIVLSTTTASG